MLAHICSRDERTQTLKQHCMSVSKLAESSGRYINLNLKSLAFVCGILHDMGKANEAFQNYLKLMSKNPEEKAKRGSVHHSPIGAIYAYDHWYQNGSPIEKITAQIISMVIRGHHGGLVDCVSPDQNSDYLNCIFQDKNKLFYNEAVNNFHKEVSNGDDLDRYFKEACSEVEKIDTKCT